MSDIGERIVCAALQFSSGLVVCGPRHFDKTMHKVMDNLMMMPHDRHDCTQGFITSRGVFIDRNRAWIIADGMGQIIRRCGGDSADGGTLYSENLY